MTIYARKLSGAGVGVLAILPFADAEESSDGETSDDTAKRTSRKKLHRLCRRNRLRQSRHRMTTTLMLSKSRVNSSSAGNAIHVVTMNGKTKFYHDRMNASGEHVTCPTKVQGEVGKIYIDLESGSKDHYLNRNRRRFKV